MFDLAAISAVRYRAEYGDSAITHLAACETRKEQERVLFRLCYTMIPPECRPSVKEFAERAYQDGDFLQKALQLKDGLMIADENAKSAGRGKSDEKFDEYQILALMATAGVPGSLLHELPILHLLSIAARVGDMKSPKENVRAMDAKERSAFFGRG